MAWALTPSIAILLASVAISFGLAAYLLVEVPEGARTAEFVGIVAVLIGAGWWATTNVVVLGSPSLLTMQLAEGFEAIGGTTVAIGWFVFAAGYTDRDAWLSMRVLWPMVGLLGIGVAVSMTIPFHDFLLTNPRRVSVGSLYVVEFDTTPGHTLFIVANYVPILAGTYAIVYRLLTDKSLYRLQVLSLVVAVAVPMAANLKDHLGVGPFPALPFSPMAFTVTGLALAVGVRRYRLLDVNPLARRRVVQRMRDGYLVLDYADRIVDYNSAAARLLDFEEGIGKHVESVLPRLDEWAEDDETELVLDRGERRTVRATTTPLDNGQKLVLLRDVTEQRAVERRYQRLIEMASDLVVVIDEGGEVTFTSPSVKRVLGIDPDTAEGVDVHEFVPEDDHDVVAEAMSAVLEAPDEIERFECRVLDSEGDVEVVDVLLRNLLDDPHVDGLVANARVITDRKERQEELKRRNDRLDQFAGIVSHDLRNPLSVAGARLELAGEECDSEHLGHVEDALGRMETIIDSTLTLAREGKAVAEMEPVAVEPLARRCWGLVETGTATLTVDSGFEIEADPERLEHVFENLFRNAVEHGSGPVDGEASDVTVHVGRTEGGFYVEDDGPGIPPEERETVFAPGETTDPDGTGFGLAIVREIVQAHGWEITVTEGTQGGARFEITGVDVR